jgi:hypothetical protein
MYRRMLRIPPVNKNQSLTQQKTDSMKQHRTLLLFVVFFLFSAAVRSQSVDDLIASSKMLGRSYYASNDYLSAYKYLMAFKYLDYKRLSVKENAAEFKRLEDVLVYCESHLKKALTAGSKEEIKIYSGRGFSSEMDSVNSILSRPAPKL